MNLFRKILFPIVPIYYLITWFRNVLYDIGFKKSQEYNFPIIAVGNLSVGGTGKSPMIEYLIMLLKEKLLLATLSRGYKRETKGFQIVNRNATAKEIGDEPLQFKKKFEDIVVAVDADRRNGIANLRALEQKPELILLDDAYQHRKVKAGLYILLTAYYDLYSDDIMLPTGNLREPIRGAKRAKIVVVTKCPEDLSNEEKQKIERKLNLESDQTLYFSSIAYSSYVSNTVDTKSIESLQNVSFTLVTGIANPKPLLDHYQSLGLKFDHLNYKDHHNFTAKEIEELNQKTIIITTEKDYVRLVSSKVSKDKLWYQPIETNILENKSKFDEQILEYIASY
ncbi:tetraacyldisaccharide 4'-kinase [Aquimarina algicola]|uniref:Tetraacyldisaccharide 4'-kinase n=1 Tax=Aquimarina algicola TaxID=2589995 RepID=A0A504JDU9_9FLAO|nr:tetraacyldisaccharide 4'-kinase [Aquimarina algicola]TPN84561.1 tetraacyldisaccharide 4'-kinase [Aquimarina algicola]